MKKITQVLAVLLSLIMMLSCTSFLASAAEPVTSDPAETQELTDQLAEAVKTEEASEVKDVLSEFVSEETTDYGNTEKKSKAYTVNSAKSSSGNSIDFIQMSDVHVFSEVLIENAGKDYNDDIVKYNKVLGETFPILNATFTAVENDVREKGLRYVLISGDLTANGEYNNHVMLATFLRSFQNEMRKKYDPHFHVFVINGNHDLNIADGAYYDENGNVINGSDSKKAFEAQVTSSSDFADIYYDLGYGEDDDDCGLNVTYYKDNTNIAKRQKHTFEDAYANLSYAADLETSDGDKIKLIAYDASEYSPDTPDAGTITVEGEERQGQATGCWMSEDHLNWIKEQCAEAKKNGQMVFGMSHYAVLPHFTIQGAVLKMFIYPDWENLSAELANAGMHYTLSGHMHCNDVGSYTSDEGETIYDIETGALSGSFPNCFREISFTQNDDGSIDCNTEIANCDRDANVDLSKCYYTYEEDGTPDYSATKADIDAINESYTALHTIDGVKYTENKNICDLSKTNVDENGNPYSVISKPFCANYGIYAFMGGKTHADAKGDAVSVVEPSIRNMAVNMVNGYINGRTYKKIINNGGIKGLLKSLLGTDLDTFLKGFLPEEVTFSVITLKRDNIIAVANAIIDQIDAKYIQDNTTIRSVAETLIKDLLDYKIGGYTLSEIASQCLIAHYYGDESSILAGTNETIKPGKLYKVVDAEKVFAEINDNNKAVNGLIDELINALLHGTNKDGEPIELLFDAEKTGKMSQGLLVDLLKDVTLSADDVYKVLPDFAGILQYPTIRQLVLGTDAKNVPVLTIIDKWAGKIIKDTYVKKTFLTGKEEELNVTDTASLAEYFIFGLVDDYLDEEQITSVSNLLVNAVASFYEDPTFYGNKYSEYTVNPSAEYLRKQGDIAGSDIKNTINYKKLPDRTPTSDNYLLPNTISVSFGKDTSTSKKFNWYTKVAVTGSDIQVIPYKENATAGDFTAANLVNVTVTKDKDKDGPKSLVYPTLDIGIYTCSEGKTMYRHAITVTGLSAGTKYVYRVGDASKGYWSKPAVMETAKGDDSSFSFVQISDNQSQTAKQYEESVGSVLNAMKKTAPDAKFVLQTGDMVDYGANMLQWSWALNGFEDYTISSVAGNHEPKGNGEGNLLNAGFTAAQDSFYNIDKGTASDKQDASEGVYYDYDYNDVHFMVINSNKLNDDNTLSDDQVEWLKKSCANTDKTWKVLAMHKSIYSNASHYDDSDVVALRAQLSKLFPELGIDVVFSGHDHVMLSTHAINNGQVTSKFDDNNTITNANGTVYTIAGKAGVKDYKVKDKDKVNEAFGFDDYFTTISDKGERNVLFSYTKAVVDGASLKVTIYAANSDGSSDEIYSYTLKKSKLTTPTGLTAKAQSASAVKLNWVKSEGANAYEVYRSTSENGTYAKVGTATSTTYTDTSVEAGKTYFYKLKACASPNSSSNMKSGFSKTVSAKAGPKQVTGLKATQKSKTAIQLSWSKVAGAESYNIYYSTSKDGDYKSVGSANEINAVINGVSAGTYYVKVAAVQAGVEGTLSTAKQVTLS